MDNVRIGKSFTESSGEINDRLRDDESFKSNPSLIKETGKFEKWQNIEPPNEENDSLNKIENLSGNTSSSLFDLTKTKGKLVITLDLINILF